MLPGYDIMSQRPSEAEASGQCLVSRGSLQCPQVQLIGHNYTVTTGVDNSLATFSSTSIRLNF